MSDVALAAAALLLKVGVGNETTATLTDYSWSTHKKQQHKLVLPVVIVRVDHDLLDSFAI